MNFRSKRPPRSNVMTGQVHGPKHPYANVLGRSRAYEVKSLCGDCARATPGPRRESTNNAATAPIRHFMTGLLARPGPMPAWSPVARTRTTQHILSPTVTGPARFTSLHPPRVQCDTLVFRALV